MTRPVRIGLLGCGTVGGGVLRILAANQEAFAARVGAPLEVARVAVRDMSKGRVPECNQEWLTTDPEDVLLDDSVEVIVEVMGGEEPARSLLEKAIAGKKSVVTANKLLIATHGPSLLKKAVENGVDLAFEASVGGGIPIIRTLREALASDRIESVHGILNGTCNFILTKMKAEGVSFADALNEAQQLGYAEADPTLDVDGHDAAQKLVVMSMLAFGAEVDSGALHIEGIREIDQLDFYAAERFGLTIKHLAIGRDHGDQLSLKVHPSLVPKDSVLANIDDVLNGVHIVGRGLGPCLLVGRGAGDMPTAVSVVADLVDVARSRREGEPGLSTRAIRPKPRALLPMEETRCRYYLRFDVADAPGVLAVVAGALGEEGVSIEQMVQQGRARDSDRPVSLLIVTHTSLEGAVQRAITKVAGAEFMRAPPRLIRIERP